MSELPISHVMAHLDQERTLSLREVGQKAGVPTEILREVFAAADRLSSEGYSDADVRYAEHVRELLEVYPLEVVVKSGRVRQRAITSVVVNELVLSRDVMRRRMDEHDDDLAAAAEAELAILPTLTALLGEDYLHILGQLLRTDAVREAANTPEREITMAIGFVDVVGYTALSSKIDPEGLIEVLEDFEQLVHDVVSRHDDVMLAKFIGDAAMLVSTDVVELAEALLDIVMDRGRLGEAPRRAGLARGPLVVRDGDYFGTPANLAARLTDNAEAWSLLAADDLEKDLVDGFELKRTRTMKFRGIGDHRPIRVRRPQPES